MAKILFLQNGIRELEGLMSISGYVKRHGHKTDVLIDGLGSLENKIIHFNPDVIGLYVLTKDHNWSLETSKKIKDINKKIPILLGGPHPTFYPKILNEPLIDAICIGEGEKAVEEILERIDLNRSWDKTESIWLKKEGKVIKNEIQKLLDPGEFPLVDRGLYQDIPGIRDPSNLQIMTSRGCPFNCFFCINYGVQKLYGKTRFRVKKIGNVISEIKESMLERKVDTIHFQDDIFGINKSWLKEFSRLYKKEINLPFYSLLRCELIDKDLIQHLKNMGCYEVGIGVEAGNERIRNDVLGKRLKTDIIKKAVSVLKSEKMPFHTFSMFGVPEENLREAFETLDLNIKLSPDIAYTQMFHPYPGTKFFTSDVEERIIKKGFDLFKTNYPYSKDFKKIQRVQKWAMLTVRYPFLRDLVPLIINIPFDSFHDFVSRSSWERLYHQRLKNEK